MAKNTRKNNARKNNTRKNKTMSGGKKRGMNPYMKFANKHRADVMRSMPGAKIPDIGRALGKKWRALSDAEKKSYA
jgi:hypothetical protein